MNTKVAKFGGSSIATPERLERIRRIVSADPSIRYVVVSAPGKEKTTDQKVTDLLMLAYDETQKGVPCDSTLNIVGNKFRMLAQSVGIPIDRELEKVRQGIAFGRSRDFIVSRGEYLSAQIVSQALGFDFVDASDLIRFRTDGKVDATDTQERMRVVLRDRKAVVPGFYGSLPNGEIKTFPRGGSDISGAFVAAGVHASVYQNYTDVPGFFTGDPKLISGTRQIPRLTFQEVRELSWAGANVLQAETIFPVREAGIPIEILSTFEPHRGGTRICPDDSLSENPTGITGIAGRSGFSQITLEKAGMNEERGFAERALGIFAHHGVSIEHMPSSVDSLCIIAADSEIGDRLDIIKRGLDSECCPDKITIERNNLALIAIVGKQAGQNWLFSIGDSLNTAGVPIKMINLGSSKLSVIIGVDNNRCAEAMQVVHTACIS